MPVLVLESRATVPCSRVCVFRSSGFPARDLRFPLWPPQHRSGQLSVFSMASRGRQSAGVSDVDAGRHPCCRPGHCHTRLAAGKWHELPCLQLEGQGNGQSCCITWPIFNNRSASRCRSCRAFSAAWILRIVRPIATLWGNVMGTMTSGDTTPADSAKAADGAGTGECCGRDLMEYLRKQRVRA